MSTLRSSHNSSSEESLLNLEYNKKLVQELKNKISVLTRCHKVIAMCPQPTEGNWKGVSIATTSMFYNQWLEIPQYYSNQVVSDKHFNELFLYFKHQGGEAIILNGFLIYRKIATYSKNNIYIYIYI